MDYVHYEPRISNRSRRAIILSKGVHFVGEKQCGSMTAGFTILSQSVPNCYAVHPSPMASWFIIFVFESVDARGYKTFFILNSTEISTAHKN